MLDIAATCLVITALLAYLNHRFIRLPSAIGVMVAALALSLALLVLDATGLNAGLRQHEEALVRSIDFSSLLMQGMLSLLLFAGALHVDLSELRALRWPVAILAVLGTVASTATVGLLMWWGMGWAGLPVPLLECLLFGALISPTDPIAVMGILKSAGAPRDVELVIAGESLFNDGVGVVIFSLLLGVLASGHTPSVSDGAWLLIHEAGGGLVFGAVLGWVTFVMLRSVDNYEVEVLLSLAAVMGGYALASRLHISGPLAMVVVGLIIGNHGRELAMSDTTRRYLDMFWELLDQILNAILFVLMGMAVLLVRFDRLAWVGALLAVAVVLLARVITVGLPVAALPGVFKLPAGAWKVLSWGGLRGGISIALALSIPAGPHRDTLLAMTYVVVVFSILIQGTTIGLMTRHALRGH
jgi:CPA1 family monovalent cation:H+ antiporter